MNVLSVSKLIPLMIFTDADIQKEMKPQALAIFGAMMEGGEEAEEMKKALLEAAKAALNELPNLIKELEEI